MSDHRRSVLVIGPGWLGDIVLMHAFVQVLLEREGEADVDVVGPRAYAPLVGRMSGVREAVVLDVRHGRLGVRARARAARVARSRGYQQAYVIPSSLKSALVPFLAGIPVRTGYRGEMRYGLINDIRRPVPLDDLSCRNVRGYLGLLGPAAARRPSIPRPALAVDRENQDRLVRELDLQLGRPVVALAPGAAYGPAKRWPSERFRDLARHAIDSGWTVWILGGPDEIDAGKVITEGSPVRGSGPRIQNLCGRTTVLDAVDLLGLADVTVANDSGLAHVAAAAGSAIVALFGPTSPEFAPPLSARSEVVHLEMECSPCRSRTCPLGHHRCLRDISVADVAARVHALMGTPGPRH